MLPIRDKNMLIFQIIFWMCLLILGIFYVGYYVFCFCIVNLKKLKIKKKRNFRPSISIVIPTWNEEKTIEGKLKNTLKLKYPKKIEIIVIDDGSNDRTKEIVKKFRRVKLIPQKQRKGKASVLNKAFKICKGDLIVITDADCRLDKNALLEATPYFADDSIGGITGRQIIPNPSESTATKIEKEYRNFFYLLREAESRLDSTFIFDGPFTIFRRSLVDNIFEDTVADDSEIALRIREKGYRTLSIKEAKYIEYADKKIDDRTRRKKRRAQGLVQIMTRFFKKFFLNPRYGLFGLIIFPVEFFMHIISPIAIVLCLISIPFLPASMIIFLSICSALIILIPWTRSIFFTFIYSQYACLRGMISYLIKGPSHKWEQVGGTRRSY